VHTGSKQSLNKHASLVAGNHCGENIRHALGLIKEDLEPLLESRSVLIKPNLTATKNIYSNTSAEACEAVVEFLKNNHDDFRKMEIIIGENSGSAFYEGVTTKKVFSDFKYDKIAKKYRNVKLADFSDCKDFRAHEIENVAGKHMEILVCKDTEKFDYVISVAPPKTHNVAIYTGAVKNMMGLVKKEDMNKVHGMKIAGEDGSGKTLMDILPTGTIPWIRRRFPQSAIDFAFMKYPNYKKSVKVINRNIANVLQWYLPDLAVVDGMYGMEGNGPVDGTGVKLGVAVASTDALKADGLGCRLMGIKPECVGYLHYLEEAGYGSLSNENVIGGGVEHYSKKFKMHGTFPVQCEWDQL